MSQLDQHLAPLISGSDELIFFVLDISALPTLHFKRDGVTHVKFELYGLSCAILVQQTLSFVITCPLDAVRRFVIGGVRGGGVRRTIKFIARSGIWEASKLSF